MGSKARIFAAAVAGLLLAAGLAGNAAAFENTIRVKVEPGRQWQCGDRFFPTGGSQRYQMVRILADGHLLGTYDLARPTDCNKTLEYAVDLPDKGKATISVEVGGHRMDAPVTGRNRNRLWTVFFFVDTAHGELTADYVQARGVPPKPSQPPAPGTFRNTILFRVARDRLAQCGTGFTGGETYRHAKLTLDGADVATFDFANPADCNRVVTAVRDLPDGGVAHARLTVGPYTMPSDLTARNRDRTWTIWFFVDAIWGEVTADGKPSP